MIKIFAFLILLSVNAFALSWNDADRSEIGFENTILNPGGEIGKQYWTGTNVTVSLDTSAANLRSGKASLKFTATAGGGFVDDTPTVIKLGTNNCEVSGYYKTTATDATLGVYLGSTLVRSETLGAASVMSKISGFSFACSDVSSAYKIRFTFPTNGTVFYFDDGYRGLIRNPSSTSSASFVGSLEWSATSGCGWSTTSTSFGNFSNDNECDDQARTVKGNVTDSSSGLRPEFTITVKPGHYMVVYTGRFLVDNISSENQVENFWQMHDGTTSVSPIAGTMTRATNAATELIASWPNFVLDFDVTASGTKTYNLQAKTGNGNTYAHVNAASNNSFKISVYYFPAE